MKKFLALCSFCFLVAGCAHERASYGSAGGFAADCITDSAYSLGSTYAYGPSYAYGPTYGYAAAGGWGDGLCRDGGRRTRPYSSPEVAAAILQRASVVGHTRSRPDPRVITRPETGSTSGGAAASSSVVSGSGSGFAGSGAHAPSAPAAPAMAVSSPAVSSSPASQPAPHSD